VHDTGLTDEEWMQTQEGRIAVITLSGEFLTLARIVEKDIDFNLDRSSTSGCSGCSTAWRRGCPKRTP
jgi:hypothetical protein